MRNILRHILFYFLFGYIMCNATAGARVFSGIVVAAAGF